MPRSAPRARRRRSLPKKARRTNRGPTATRPPVAPADKPADDRIAHVVDAQQLARVVPRLAPETLQALIRHRGLDISGDLLAAATPEQLTAVFDIDLWRRSQSGRDDRFDVDRFGDWLEALVESGELLAARIIAAMDEHLVIAGLSRYVRVFDVAALEMPAGDDEMIDGGELSFSGLSREVAGYVVRARRTDAWDAIVALLFTLAEHYPDSFHVVMHECRRLSNSKPEIDGLDDLLRAPEQLLHEVAVDRDSRRSQQGYVTAADARAFLQMARQRHRDAGAPRSVNPIVAASFRAADEGVTAVERNRQPPAGTVERSDADDRESVEVVAALLGDAGLAAPQPRALLAGPSAGPSRTARIEALLREVADTDDAAFAARSRELAFLANVLMAGCSVQSRAFTPGEASEAALAICNLGLERWPAPDALEAHGDLVAAFEIGWAVLHELCMFVAQRLIDALADLQSLDDEVQEGLHSLRRELVRQCASGTPWRARDALDVFAMIDMPVCVSLQALFDECPVLPDALTAILDRRTGAISPTAFEFISTEDQIRRVRDFAGRLPALTL